MFGVPEWAVGVGVIILLIPTAIVLLRVLLRFLHFPDPEGKSHLLDPTERGQVMEDLQVRLGELDQLKQRVGELEERVDFAERLLAKQHEGQRLGPAQD